MSFNALSFTLSALGQASSGIAVHTLISSSVFNGCNCYCLQETLLPVYGDKWEH